VAETVRSPLAGKRIVITRAAVQSEEFARELSALGAIPVVLPLDAAITRLEQFGWIVFYERPSGPCRCGAE